MTAARTSALGNLYLLLNDSKEAKGEYNILIGIDAARAESLRVQISKARQ